MATCVGINGFGHIGRDFFRAALEQGVDVEIITVNDLADTKTLARLFKYDSILGHSGGEVSYDESSIAVNGKAVKAFAQRSPADLPWGELGVDVVIKPVGFFIDDEGTKAHLETGAKKVVVSTLTKSVDGTFVMGANRDNYDGRTMNIASNASCTTNCLAPLAKVLHTSFGIVRDITTTIHFYTSDQHVLDAPHSDLRHARVAAPNMIPMKVGATQAVALVPPEFKSKFDGPAVRVPTPTGSLTDLTFQAKKEVSVEAVNAVVKAAAGGELKDILEYTEDPIISTDIVGDSYSSIFDAGEIKVVGDLAKVLSQYDNGRGYSDRPVQLVVLVGSKFA